jgi:hypothetical protein
MNNNIIYLDNLQFDNPNYSKKVNTFYKIFTPTTIVIYLISGLYLFFTQSGYHYLIYIIQACIFIMLLVCQIFLYRRYGRKFIQYTKDSLVLKHKYLQKAITVPWKNIDTIQFVEQRFHIKLNDSVLKEIMFKSPLEKYLDIRASIKEHASSQIRIIDKVQP